MLERARNEWFFDGKGNAILYRKQDGMMIRTCIKQDDVISYDYETHVFHVERSFVGILSCFMNKEDFEKFKNFHTGCYPKTMLNDDEEE